MDQVLPAIEAAFARLRARQMVVEIAVMELVRALPPQARRRFAERFPVHVATALEQQAGQLSPTMEHQVAALLTALQQAAGDRAPPG